MVSSQKYLLYLCERRQERVAMVGIKRAAVARLTILFFLLVVIVFIVRCEATILPAHQAGSANIVFMKTTVVIQQKNHKGGFISRFFCVRSTNRLLSAKMSLLVNELKNSFSSDINRTFLFCNWDTQITRVMCVDSCSTPNKLVVSVYKVLTKY